MTLSVQQRGSVFLVVALCLLALGIYPSFSTHDLQRTIQIVVGFCALIYGLSVSSLACRQRLVDRPAAIGLAVIVGLGLVSSLLAHQPSWALTELALVITCGAIAAALATLRRNGDESLDRALVLFVVLLCLIKSSQYLYAGAIAFTSGEPVLNTDLLLSGFSNKRFYGQFQTFTLPLLALPLLASATSRAVRSCVFALLCVWWLIAISGGTRGTWLGLGTAGIVLAFLGPWGRRWLAWQLAALCCALLLYWLLFVALTGYLGIEIDNIAGDRLTTSLSGRGPIWWQAWDMIRERPLLGFGPMHFADIANDIAAHPHQAILQWASEWGVLSTLCVAGLALRGIWPTLNVLRQQRSVIAPVDLLRLCLFAALIGALTQAMVDGVIVMPNSQLWLALVVGWLMALHPWRTCPSATMPLLYWMWTVLIVLSVALLVFVAIRDVPHINERNQHYVGASKVHLQPRFWAQGVIALPKQ
ncbi:MULTISPECIES: O-antigen ligase family protein [unclassified Pseudomonas]|uniref:O-antigen ligase family protein n=1 Tax=unclassified Pseudomonas TaxID=196821 RepID=UPI0011EDC720|nr:MULTISPECIES: O-antigen ligase family protein [unclassified Pseudomonas]KAA0949531.1 O-antigen ligase family protein [Pseudomonas sp. ANT_H4]KAA0954411.1 O-antigen ligase family protein [Pseudomonas sp. ANT_H14]